MKHWAVIAGAVLGAGLWLASPVPAEDAAPVKKPPARAVVEIRPNRIVLMDVARAGDRLVAVGERGFTLVSDDHGETWKGVPTPVTRTLTAVVFRDNLLGIAVGHGGSLVRTEDGGRSWKQVTIEEAGTDSLLGVTWLGGDHFAAYGAFGLYFDSQDAGTSWQRVTVFPEESEFFDRHFSQVVPVGNSLLLVGESGTLARSDDGGATWTQLASPYQGSFFGAIAAKDGSVLVYGMRGNIYRSTDVGATWQKVGLGTTASLNGGRQLADGRMLLVGNAGLLALSGDGGQSFAAHWARPGRGLAALAEADGKIILAGDGGIVPLDPAWLAAR
jgi:photosystem II stability/assembly factor-like uncharacterized protein